MDNANVTEEIIAMRERFHRYAEIAVFLGSLELGVQLLAEADELAEMAKKFLALKFSADIGAVVTKTISKI